MRSRTFSYEIQFPTTFVLSFFHGMRIFAISVLCAYWNIYINTGYVDCIDVTIYCPLRIEPTCVSNHLGCTVRLLRNVEDDSFF